MYLFNLVLFKLTPHIFRQKLIIPHTKDLQPVQHDAGLIELLRHMREHVEVL